MHQLKALLYTAALCTTLTACGTKFASPRATPPSPQPIEQPPVIDSAPILSPEEPVSPAIRPTKKPDAQQARSLPAAVALRSQAQMAAENGNHSRAIGLLERAIRISPADPVTFQALAESHLAMNRPHQALEMTKRAMNLNPTIEQQLALEALAQRSQAQM